MTWHTIGDDIRAARYARDWTVERLADEAGVDADHVRAAEAGDSDAIGPILHALVLAPVVMAADAAHAVRLLVPIIERADDSKRAIIIGAALHAAGRAAADLAPPVSAVQNVHVLQGDVDVDQAAGQELA